MGGGEEEQVSATRPARVGMPRRAVLAWCGGGGWCGGCRMSSLPLVLALHVFVPAHVCRRHRLASLYPGRSVRPAGRRLTHSLARLRAGRWRVMGGATVCGAGFLAYRALRGLPLRQILMLVAKMRDRVPEQVETALNSGERSRLILVRPQRARTGALEFVTRRASGPLPKP